MRDRAVVRTTNVASVMPARAMMLMLLTLAAALQLADGQTNCDTFCAPGRECTPPCQSWGCSNCESNEGTCEYTHDGECDEPDLCARGTDSADCGRSSGSGDSCRYANDGECDEPDLCARGTDSADCGRSSGSGDSCRYGADDGSNFDVFAALMCDTVFCTPCTSICRMHGCSCGEDARLHPPTTVQVDGIPSTVTVQDRQTRVFAFDAVSGTRYMITVRVGEGSGEAPLCTTNAADDPNTGNGPGSCSRFICGSSSCARDFCPECRGAHYCDLACGFRCIENGVTDTNFNLYLPGHDYRASYTQASKGILNDLYRAADKDITFNAHVTGMFTAAVQSRKGSGPVTLTVTSMGSVLESAPRLHADAQPHLLSVQCRLADCILQYDDSFDGDIMKEPGLTSGASLDLVLPDAQAGLAYAFLIELPAGQTAVQIEATMYQAGAAAGADGFEPVISGPLGQWSATPEGSQSFAESEGCSNEDRWCLSLPDNFGIHPGETFPRLLRGTWVAPVSGAVLLRVQMNCDSVFFADVEVEGCHIPTQDDLTWGCGTTANGYCHSELRLTVTPGAYFDQSAGSSTTMQPVFGSVMRTDTIVIARANIEAQAMAAWRADQENGRRLQTDGGSLHPPTLEDMLDETNIVAHNILIDLLLVEQQPAVVYPTMFELGDGSNDGVDGYGHRRVQLGGDHLTVNIETHAPSDDDADGVVQRLVARVPGAQRSGLAPRKSCDLQSRSRAVNLECCDEVGEDCSSGTPATCNVGCAEVVLPFFDDCSTALGTHASDFDGVVALCHKALPPGAWKGRRQLQCDGLSCGCPPGGCHPDSQICGLGSIADECTVQEQTTQSIVLTIPRKDIETTMREKFESMSSSPANGCSRPCDCLRSPPTLDEALVSGSEANKCLASIFNEHQKPLAIEPTQFCHSGKSADGYGDGYGRRRQLQLGGDQLYITVETHAATPRSVADGVDRLGARLQGTVVNADEHAPCLNQGR